MGLSGKYTFEKKKRLNLYDISYQEYDSTKTCGNDETVCEQARVHASHAYVRFVMHTVTICISKIRNYTFKAHVFIFRFLYSALLTSSCLQFTVFTVYCVTDYIRNINFVPTKLAARVQRKINCLTFLAYQALLFTMCSLPLPRPDAVFGYYANSADSHGLHCLLTETSMENAVKIETPTRTPKSRVEMLIHTKCQRRYTMQS